MKTEIVPRVTRFLLSLPERVLRSGTALAAGLLCEIGEVRIGKKNRIRRSESRTPCSGPQIHALQQGLKSFSSKSNSGLRDVKLAHLVILMHRIDVLMLSFSHAHHHSY